MAEKWEKPGRRQQEPGARELLAPLPDDRAGGRRARRAARLLGPSCCRTYTVKSRRRAARPDGQHLEPVPVHGDLQHVALRLVLRDRHRPRHGLPRLEPGPARASCTWCPTRARERILDIAATQFADGSAYHQYQPLTKRGNNDVGCGFNDDPLWLILGVAAYVKETGDFGILDETVPFDNDPKNAAPALRAPASARSTTCSNNLGPHGLPLIGRADWNDCLNLNCFSETPGESFQTTGNRAGRTAESVFIAGMFVARRRPTTRRSPSAAGFADEARAAPRARRAAWRRRSLEHGWDGEWFLRAYDFFGKKVGTEECEEGQIFIEPQGYCVMARHRRRDDRPRAEGARLGARTGWRRAHGIVLQQPGLHAIPPRARRDQLLPAGLQGERRHLLPQQPVDHDRRDGDRPRRPGLRATTRRSPPPTARTSPRSTASSRTSTRR